MRLQECVLNVGHGVWSPLRYLMCCVYCKLYISRMYLAWWNTQQINRHMNIAITIFKKWKNAIRFHRDISDIFGNVNCIFFSWSFIKIQDTSSSSSVALFRCFAFIGAIISYAYVFPPYCIPLCLLIYSTGHTAWPRLEAKYIFIMWITEWWTLLKCSLMFKIRCLLISQFHLLVWGHPSV